MIPAVSLAQGQSSKIAFRGEDEEDKKPAQKPDFNDDQGDQVDLNSEDKETADAFSEYQEKLREKSDKYINSDKAHERFAGRALKFGADLLVVAAAFFVSKGAGRGGFQSLKEFAKNKAVRPIIENVGKELKTPMENVGKHINEKAEEFINSPKGEKLIHKFVGTKFGKRVMEFLGKRNSAEAIVDGVEGAAKDAKTAAQKVEDVVADLSGASGATAAAANVFSSDPKTENQNDPSKKES